ncbi:uracil-DNA glycosylase family protein [Helicobacter typhlonius]
MMKAQILKMLQLKLLYGQYACGERYVMPLHHPTPYQPLHNDLESVIKNCSLCNRIKHCKEPIVGLCNPQSQLCFISETPLVDENGIFVQNKSAIMLENIITRVFGLSKHQVSILSLIKCSGNPYIEKSEILSCMGFCLSQLQKITPKVCILLGNQVVEHILGVHLEAGRILWHNNRIFLMTYSLNELVRNPSLKKEAHTHFLLAKGQI